MVAGGLLEQLTATVGPPMRPGGPMAVSPGDPVTVDPGRGVRKVKTASGATAVQIVEKRNGRRASWSTSDRRVTRPSWRR